MQTTTRNHFYRVSCDNLETEAIFHITKKVKSDNCHLPYVTSTPYQPFFQPFSELSENNLIMCLHTLTNCQLFQSSFNIKEIDAREFYKSLPMFQHNQSSFQTPSLIPAKTRFKEHIPLQTKQEIIIIDDDENGGSYDKTQVKTETTTSIDECPHPFNDGNSVDFSQESKIDFQFTNTNQYAVLPMLELNHQKVNKKKLVLKWSPEMLSEQDFNNFVKELEILLPRRTLSQDKIIALLHRFQMNIQQALAAIKGNLQHYRVSLELGGRERKIKRQSSILNL